MGLIDKAIGGLQKLKEGAEYDPYANIRWGIKKKIKEFRKKGKPFAEEDIVKSLINDRAFKLVQKITGITVAEITDMVRIKLNEPNNLENGGRIK